MLISNLVLLMAVTGQNAGVTVDLPAQSLEALMPKLAKATGQNLAVGNLMTKDVVLVRVKDASVDELLKNMASATGGMWVQSGGTLRLDKDLNLEAKEAQEAVAERAAFLKDAIDKLSQEAAKQPKFDPNQFRQQVEDMRQQQPGQGGPGGPGGLRAGFQNMQLQMPAGRAILQTLAAMRAEDLARIGGGQRVVFSSRPTAMQKPLPGNALSILSSFMADQQKLTASMAAMRDEFRSQQQRNGEAPARAPQQQNQQPLVAVKSFLIVTRNANSPGIQVVYIAADANGQTVGTGNMMVGQAFNGPFDPRQEQPQSGQNQQATPQGEGVELSAKGAAAADVFGRNGFMQMGGGPRGGGFGGGPQDQQAKINPELIQLLKDPVANDPLSFHVSEVVLHMAGDKNVVALLPDSLAGQIGRAIRGKSSLETMAGQAEAWRVTIQDADGWFLLAPKRKLDARLERVDRTALKALVEAIATKGSARLDDVAKYALKSPSVNSSGIDLGVVRAIDPSSAQAVNQVYGNDRDALLFFAGLNPVNRTNMANGQKLIVTTIGGGTMNVLANMVYNSQDGPAVTRGNNSAQTLPGIAGPVQRGAGGPGGRGRGGVGNMSTERTEILPTGVPTNSLVALVVATEPVAKAVNSAGQARVYSAQMLAGDRARSEAPQPTNANQNRPQPSTPNWEGYVPGTQTSYTLIFELAPGITLTRQLEDTAFNANAKAVAYDSLPNTFQQAVADRYQMMKDRMAERSAAGDQQGQRGRRGGGRRGQQGRNEPPPGP